MLCALALLLLFGPAYLGGALPGTAPMAQGGSGPIPWAATLAVGTGALWGYGITLAEWGRRRRWVRAALALALPLGVWLLGLGEVARGPLPLGLLPDPQSGGEALSGLLALGVFLGAGRWGNYWPVGALAISAILDGAPAGWGLIESPLGGAPWGPSVAAAMLDLSPRAFVMESGALDWMRHPEIYGPVGTDRIGPELRTGWTGSMACRILFAAGALACTWATLRPKDR